MAIPKEGYFKHEQGRYGPTLPQDARQLWFHDYCQSQAGADRGGPRIWENDRGSRGRCPDVLAPLKLHYLRWVLFDIGNDTYFMYQGIFDTDFDKYTEDAIRFSRRLGSTRYLRI